MDKTIIVLDIETTGVSKYESKIVEIGIVKLNLETGQVSELYNSLIREDGFDLSHTEGKFGWIFRNSDLSFNDVCNAPSLESQRSLLQTIFNQYKATAYNKRFDFDFLINRGFVINELPCPMIIATPLLKLTDYNFDDNDNVYEFQKWPSVEEAWSYFFEFSEYKEAHRGLDDAFHEAQIVMELFKIGKFKVFFNTEKEKLQTTKHNVFTQDDCIPNFVEPNFQRDFIKNDLEELIPYRKGDRWGYCDQNKRLIIDCIYKNVKPFKNGIARVRSNQGKYGFINNKGMEIIPSKYEDAKKISQDLIAVKLKTKWGYFDINGNLIIDFIFDDAFNFREDRAAIKMNSKYGFIDKYGNKIIECKYADIQGELFSNYFSRKYSFHEGLALVRRSCPEKNYRYGLSNYYYGYIDTNGNEIIYPNYDDAFHFKEGFGRIYQKSSCYGFININVEKVFYDFKYLNDFSEGFASFKKNEMWGFINKKFEIEIDPIYENAKSFSEGFASVRDGFLYGFINKNNELEIPCIFEDVNDFSEGLAAIKKKNSNNNTNRWGFIDKNGYEIISPKYFHVNNFKNGLSKVEIKGKINEYGYINKNGIEFWEE